jgi:hypothetical protein
MHRPSQLGHRGIDKVEGLSRERNFSDGPDPGIWHEGSSLELVSAATNWLDSRLNMLPGNRGFPRFSSGGATFRPRGRAPAVSAIDIESVAVGGYTPDRKPD